MDFLADRTYQRDIKPVPTLSCGGVFRYRSGERLHGMQEVTGSIPVFSTKKSTVLRRKYGAFLFVEADFWGLHCFACTVFKKNVCRPFFQQAVASSPSIDAAKGGGLPQ